MANWVVVEKKPPTNPWIKESDFPVHPLKIEFNDDLKDDEQEWFNELLIAGLYPDFTKLKKYAEILKDWTDIFEKGKIDRIASVILGYWELVVAFNYVLPSGAKHLAIEIEEKHIKKKNKALGTKFNTRFDDIYLKLQDREKFRTVLTTEVEKRAIKAKRYKFILYALYMYRTKFRVNAEPTPTSYTVYMDRNARDYLAHIVKTREDGVVCEFALKEEALEKFIKHFKTYVIQVFKLQCFEASRIVGEGSGRPLEYQYLINAIDVLSPARDQGPLVGEDKGVLLQQECARDAYGGKYTPFQILLGNVCSTLFADCKDTLLQFKQHLLNLSAFARVMINVGIEENYIFGLLTNDRKKRLKYCRERNL